MKDIFEIELYVYNNNNNNMSLDYIDTQNQIQYGITDKKEKQIIYDIERIGNIFHINETIIVQKIYNETIKIRNYNYDNNKCIIFLIFMALKENLKKDKKEKSDSDLYSEYANKLKESLNYQYLDIHNEYLMVFFIANKINLYDIINNVIKKIS